MPDPEILILSVRAQPRARRQGVSDIVIESDGAVRLRIAVTAPPEDGRATRAVCAVLAEALGVAASRVSVRSGGAAREKRLAVEGDPDALRARLRALIR